MVVVSRVGSRRTRSQLDARDQRIIDASFRTRCAETIEWDCMDTALFRRQCYLGRDAPPPTAIVLARRVC